MALYFFSDPKHSTMFVVFIHYLTLGLKNGSMRLISCSEVSISESQEPNDSKIKYKMLTFLTDLTSLAIIERDGSSAYTLSQFLCG